MKVKYLNREADDPHAVEFYLSLYKKKKVFRVGGILPQRLDDLEPEAFALFWLFMMKLNNHRLAEKFDRTK